MESQFLILVNGLKFVTINMSIYINMYFDILIVSDLHCASEALCSEMLALCLSLSYILSKQDFSRYILHFPCHRPGVFYRDSWFLLK